VLRLLEPQDCIVTRDCSMGLSISLQQRGDPNPASGYITILPSNLARVSGALLSA